MTVISAIFVCTAMLISQLWSMFGRVSKDPYTMRMSTIWLLVAVGMALVYIVLEALRVLYMLDYI